MELPIVSPGGVEVDPGKVALRRFPPPYRAMVAICSDIDQTRIDVFREIHRFMNTREETCVGRGLGLDIADSLWMYKSPHADAFRDNLAYFADYDWSQPGPYARELLHYARAGWIDTLHSYGNFNHFPARPTQCSREHAIHALEVLERNGVELRVWVNHGGRNNRQNLGDQDWYEGDDPASPAYHLDFLRNYGTEYIWSHAAADRLGAPGVVHPMEMRDGSRMFGFPRLTIVRDFPDAAHIRRLRGFGHTEAQTGSRLHAWLPQALAFQLSDEALQALVERGHMCVFAQHLGAIAPMTAFDREMVEALCRLRRWQDDGAILVAGTARLLHYNRVRDHLVFTVEPGRDRLVIDIAAVEDPVRGRWIPDLEDLRGITFEVEARSGPPVALSLGGEPVAAAELVRHDDRAGAGIIGIRWFSPDEHDYAAPFLARERSGYVLWSPAAREGAAAHASEVVAALRAAGTAPAGLDQARYAAATAAAIGCYADGLAAATRALEQLGFTELRDGLEIGSGAGDWCLAFLEHAERVVGVEPNAELVEVARIAAQRLGHAERARFVHRPVEQIEPGSEPFARGSFDCAWCRGALTHLDIEAMLTTIGGALGHGRPFYCAYAGEGRLLHDLGAALCGDDPEEAAGPLADLLAGYLRRCGVFRVPGSERRLLEPDDLLRACRTMGFSYIGQPGVQGGGARFGSIPGSFDLLVRKAQEPAEAKAALLQEGGGASLPQLELIARSGCARLVGDALAARDPDFTDPAARDLFARALIRAGRGGEEQARSLCDAAPALVSPLTAGLFRHDRGDYARAVRCYRRLANDHPDRAFLIGSCRLLQRRWSDARRIFARAGEPASGEAREWVGLIAAYFKAGDCHEARRAFGRFAAGRGSSFGSRSEIDRIREPRTRPGQGTSFRPGPPGKIAPRLPGISWLRGLRTVKLVSAAKLARSDPRR